MSRHFQTAIATALVLALSASIAFAQKGKGTHPDEKEIAAYRLTMDGVNKAVAATRAMVAELKKDPKFQEMMKLDAEIKALQDKDELTDAEQEKLEQLEASKEQMESALDGLSFGNATTLTEMEGRIKQFPPLAAALRSAGMTPREYATFTLAMLQASLVVGFKKSGMLKELPPGVSAENVKFVEAHEAELMAIQKALQDLQPGKQ
jgi:hypothetical protein